MPKIKLSEFLDKLVLLCSMLLFAWVGISAIFEVKRLGRISGQGRPLLSELKVNAPHYEASRPDVVPVRWEPPQSQSRGEEWVFDVFTPPVIYYDPNSREFAVTPPNLKVEDDGAEQWATFSLELIEVRLRPYRLQLVGYAGGEGDYIAYFENVATRELVLLREGQEHSELGVRLLAFDVKQIEVQSEESMTVLQNVGVARLYDQSNEQEVSLTNLETKMFSDLEARLRLLPSGATQLVKSGSRIELENGDYIIGDLSAEPEAVTITKVSKDGTRQYTKTLTPSSSIESNQRGGQSSLPESPFSIRPRRSSFEP